MSDASTAFFLVRMSHPDEQLWARHIDDHMSHLYLLVEEGVLRASGGLVDETVKTGFLIVAASDRAHVEAIIARDPFALHGVIEDLQISRWDPFVGLFAAESSGQAPGRPQASAETT